MLKKSDGSINMGKVFSATSSFEQALSDSSIDDPILSKISQLAGGCMKLSEFILDNAEHYENVENTTEVVEIILSELKEIKEDIRSIKNGLENK